QLGVAADGDGAVVIGQIGEAGDVVLLGELGGDVVGVGILGLSVLEHAQLVREGLRQGAGDLFRTAGGGVRGVELQQVAAVLRQQVHLAGLHRLQIGVPLPD